MFANLLPFRRSRSSHRADHAFVREVIVRRPVRRSRRSERLLMLGWALTIVKCVATFWIVHHYSMPFNPWWIVTPSVIAVTLCTVVYFRRN